jgi:hypothetical protein
MISKIGSSAAYAAYMSQKRAIESAQATEVAAIGSGETPAAVVEISDEAREALSEAMAEIEEEIQDQVE